MIAHRGASRAEPENTLAAFRRAVAMGADLVELDARRDRDRDGAVAVHHDPTQPPDPPSLSEALEACRPLVVNVELKNAPTEPDFDPECRLADAVAAIVHERQAAGRRDEVLISAFHRPTLERWRAVAPHVPAALLVVRPSLEALAYCEELGLVAVHPHHEGIDATFVAAAHERGLAVNVWTVDDPDQMRYLISCGVDGICTNVPDRLVALLSAWRPTPP